MKKTFYVKYIGIIDGDMGILTRKMNANQYKPRTKLNISQDNQFPIYESNKEYLNKSLMKSRSPKTVCNKKTKAIMEISKTEKHRICPKEIVFKLENPNSSMYC